MIGFSLIRGFFGSESDAKQFRAEKQTACSPVATGFNDLGQTAPNRDRWAGQLLGGLCSESRLAATQMS